MHYRAVVTTLNKISSAHDILREIEPGGFLLCTRAKLPIRGTVTVQKAPTIRESWLYRKYSTTPDRKLGQRPRPLAAILTRPLVGDDYHHLSTTVVVQLRGSNKCLAQGNKHKKGKEWRRLSTRKLQMKKTSNSRELSPRVNTSRKCEIRSAAKSFAAGW